ncbi:hypothetical protein Calab_1641 [Caldithrix abyssi DSM 13497]|uniref:GDSL-like Lipase/Acylhydrolase n=1 Tax=Caldithrix abyssi DSM 13497 TaxID=880073 RepID=H1XRQ0_CALAY|nr:SGNH/GDSL hydrolase family protein [Caldithrix abyssi]APF17119.1 GDSL-like Lipase/Acylhydrolase [Caldithrix abyssi DSM 13497]EHO41260.1 hypothetical protein Calab_1641 [Caldithrix abyssi DSM 13497]
MKIFRSLLALVLLSFFIGCQLQEPSVKQSEPVQINQTTQQLFASFVALGNSLTAGYQSAALTAKYQEYSFVNQIAKQAGYNDFQQPLLAWPGIGSYTTKGAGILVFNGFDAEGNPIIGPVPYATTGFDPFNPFLSAEVATLPRPYNNLGVPAAVLADLDSAISAAQSYSGSAFFDIVLRNPNLGNTTALDQALMLRPTLVSLWIGNNDVLGYATSGGTNPAAPTDKDVFGYLYDGLLAKLTGAGAKVVVANIPDVTSIPFFTTVPYMVEVQGQNVALVIQATDGVRQATAEDLILLSAKSIIGDVSGTYGPAGVPVGFDPSAPLPSALVLDKDEKAIAQQAVADFNATIEGLVAKYAGQVAFVDINKLLMDAADEDGYVIAGIKFTTQYLTGYIFSLDGVHPSNIGYALVANEFITAINETFGANVPTIDILQFMEEQKPVKLDVAKTASLPDLTTLPEIFGGKITL